MDNSNEFTNLADDILEETQLTTADLPELKNSIPSTNLTRSDKALARIRRDKGASIDALSADFVLAQDFVEDQYEFVRMIIQRGDKKSRKHWKLYNPRTGLWRTAEADEVKLLIKKFLTKRASEMNQALGEKPKGFFVTSKINAVYEAVGVVANDEFSIDGKDISLAVEIEDFKISHDIFPVSNGVIELKTGELREWRSEDYITKKNSLVYEADHTKIKAGRKLLKEFLDVVGTPETAEYLQMVLGSGLSGRMPENEIITFMTGSGSNGKSSFRVLIERCLSPFTLHPSDEILLSGSNENKNLAMSSMEGQRLLHFEELPSEKYLDEKVIKAITGLTVSGRAHWEEQRTVQLSATYLVNTNHLPQVKSNDDSIWRRLVVVNFPRHFVKNKADVKTKNDRLINPALARGVIHEMANDDEFLQAALRWIVDGAVKWYANSRYLPEGSELPPEVREATDAWNRGTDDFYEWFDEFIEVTGDSNDFITYKDLFKCYQYHYRDVGAIPKKESQFKEQLQNHRVINTLDWKYAKLKHKTKVRSGWVDPKEKQKHRNNEAFGAPPKPEPLSGAERIMMYSGMRFKD